MKTRKKSINTPMSKIKELVFSLFDGKMDNKKKFMILGIVLYVISPIDIIPDFLPVAGYADDILLPILLMVADRMIHEKTDDSESDYSQEGRRKVN